MRDDFLNGASPEPKSAEAKAFLAQGAPEEATTQQYVDWLLKFFERGGRISGVSNEFMYDKIHIITRDADTFIIPDTFHEIAIREAAIKAQKSDPRMGDIFKAVEAVKNEKALDRMVRYIDSGKDFCAAVPLYKDTVTELRRRGISFEDLLKFHQSPIVCRRETRTMMVAYPLLSAFTFQKQHQNLAFLSEIMLRSRHA